MQTCTHILKMQPCPNELQIRHLASLHDQITEVPPSISQNFPATRFPQQPPPPPSRLSHRAVHLHSHQARPLLQSTKAPQTPPTPPTRPFMIPAIAAVTQPAMTAQLLPHKFLRTQRITPECHLSQHPQSHSRSLPLLSCPSTRPLMHRTSSAGKPAALLVDAAAIASTADVCLVACSPIVLLLNPGQLVSSGIYHFA